MSIPVYGIVHYPHAVLAEPTKAVGQFDRSLERIVKRMVPTMREAQGVGLAANQVGLALAVATIEYVPSTKRDRGERIALHTIVNPEIREHAGEIDEMAEGCLSCPGIEVKIRRSTSIVVRYRTVDGTAVERTVSGFEARIYQHEIDHLNGLTILDRAHGQRALIEAYRANPAAFVPRTQKLAARSEKFGDSKPSLLTPNPRLP